MLEKDMPLPAVFGNKQAKWGSAADNGVEVELLDEDFTDRIDGSGNIVAFPISTSTA